MSAARLSSRRGGQAPKFTRRGGSVPNPAHPVHPCRKTLCRPAFTIVELLVVVAIVAVLASLMIPVLLIARTTVRKKQALKEIMDIKGAITQYYIERNEYPPDTTDWQDLGDLYDARSLHRYLGRTIEDARGRRRFGPYLNVKIDRVRDIEDGVGIYTDPWGKDYHMDAVHTRIVNETPMGVGAPYREGTDVPKDQRTLGFKVVSFGPDEEADLYYYPFDPDLSEPKTAEMAADDICSW